MERIRTWILWWLFILSVFNNLVRTQDANKGSGRRQKLEELLRIIKNYPETMDDYLLNQTSKEVQNETTSAMTSFVLDYVATTPLPNFDGSVLASGGSDIIPPSPVDSYQDFYRIFYGTEEGLNHLKKHYGPNGLKQARAQFGVRKELEDVRRANEHFLRIRTRARCKTPVPRLVRVKDYYPDAAREYLPRCTILHRCGEASGCCDNDAFQCVPSNMQEVALHFYTLTVSRNGIGYKSDKNNIERLLFVNHTACHCQPINDLPRIVSLDVNANQLDEMVPIEDTKTKKHHHKHHKRRHHDQVSKCRECPVPFNSRTYRDGRCGCDCFDRQKPCLKIKRGKEPLSEIERRCVEASYCHIPDCEYGIFDSSSGYCPRRHDETPRDYTLPHRTSVQIPSNHRWAFIERD